MSDISLIEKKRVSLLRIHFYGMIEVDTKKNFVWYIIFDI